MNLLVGQIPCPPLIQYLCVLQEDATNVPFCVRCGHDKFGDCCVLHREGHKCALRSWDSSSYAPICSFHVFRPTPRRDKRWKLCGFPIEGIRLSDATMRQCNHGPLTPFSVHNQVANSVTKMDSQSATLCAKLTGSLPRTMWICEKTQLSAEPAERPST